MSSFNPTPNSGKNYIADFALAFIIAFVCFVLWADASNEYAYLAKSIIIFLAVLIFLLILLDKYRRL